MAESNTDYKDKQGGLSLQLNNCFAHNQVRFPTEVNIF